PLRRAREQALAARLAQIGAPADGARWADTLADATTPGGLVGAVIANEVADALPTHRIVKQGDDLLELYVTVDAQGRFAEQAAPASTPALLDYLDRYAIPWQAYPDGWRAEVCLAAEAWMRELASHLARGALMIIDYGEAARRLYSRDRRHGTLIAYRQHRVVEQPLALPGQQDLTAHVNFSALVKPGRAEGLRLVELCTQAHLLTRLGIQAEVETLATRLYPYADSERHTSRGQLDYLRRASLRNAVKVLLDPEGLGGFHALTMHRGLPGLRTSPPTPSPIGGGGGALQAGGSNRA
ncbi:MAG TPA: class I SAM-dependent methyltransferase, partial [Ktedonobacterales bacterium]|nr:class I SAM-dependent methyltransferase [Ktedonobacterales bacterium]